MNVCKNLTIHQLGSSCRDSPLENIHFKNGFNSFSPMPNLTPSRFTDTSTTTPLHTETVMKNDIYMTFTMRPVNFPNADPCTSFLREKGGEGEGGRRRDERDTRYLFGKESTCHVSLRDPRHLQRSDFFPASNPIIAGSMDNRAAKWR